MAPLPRERERTGAACLVLCAQHTGLALWVRFKRTCTWRANMEAATQCNHPLFLKAGPRSAVSGSGGSRDDTRHFECTHVVGASQRPVRPWPRRWVRCVRALAAFVPRCLGFARASGVFVRVRVCDPTVVAPALAAPAQCNYHHQGHRYGAFGQRRGRDRSTGACSVRYSGPEQAPATAQNRFRFCARIPPIF